MRSDSTIYRSDVKLDRYEQRFVGEYLDYAEPMATRWSEAMDVVKTPFTWSVSKAKGFAPSDVAIYQRTVEQITQAFATAMEAASADIRTDKEREALGKALRTTLACEEDFHAHSLEVLHKRLRRQRLWKSAASFVTGTATGISSTMAPGWGLGAAAGEGVALVGAAARISLRTAALHGVDIDTDLEALFAIQAAFASRGPAGGAASIGGAGTILALRQISIDVAKRKTWAQLEKHLIVRAMREAASRLGIKLTKKMLAKSIPAVGALVGGGFSADMINRVHRNAMMVYGHRFLCAKYGYEEVEHAENIFRELRATRVGGDQVLGLVPAVQMPASLEHMETRAFHPVQPAQQTPGTAPGADYSASFNDLLFGRMEFED